MGKKVNPNKIPKTQADVNRAKEEGINMGVHCATAIFFNVLLDKFDGDKIALDVWKEIIKLSEEVKEGRVKIPEIVRMLKEEYNIEV